MLEDPTKIGLHDKGIQCLIEQEVRSWWFQGWLIWSWVGLAMAWSSPSVFLGVLGHRLVCAPVSFWPEDGCCCLRHQVWRLPGWGRGHFLPWISFYLGRSIFLWSPLALVPLAAFPPRPSSQHWVTCPCFLSKGNCGGIRNQLPLGEEHGCVGPAVHLPP